MWRREEMRPWKGLQVWGWSWAATASHCLWRCSGGRTGWRELSSFSSRLLLALSWGKRVFVHSATLVQKQQTPSQPLPFQPNSSCPPQVPWEYPSCICIIISSQDGSCCGPINTCLSLDFCRWRNSNTPAFTYYSLEWHRMRCWATRGRRSLGETLHPDCTCIEISFNDDFFTV